MMERTPCAKLIDAFLAAVRRHGLDVGEAVEFPGTEGLQQPPIAARWSLENERQAVMIPIPTWLEDEAQVVLLDRYGVDDLGRIVAPAAIRNGSAHAGRIVDLRLPMRFVVLHQTKLTRGRVVFMRRGAKCVVWDLGDLVAVDDLASLPAVPNGQAESQPADDAGLLDESRSGAAPPDGSLDGGAPLPDDEREVLPGPWAKAKEA